MKVTIRHGTRTEGTFSKKTYFEAAVIVQFTAEERSIIDRYELGDVTVLERAPAANQRVNPQLAESDYYLKIRHLIAGDAYACATPLIAKNYDADLRKALPTVKAYLDANATPLTGTDTFEL